MLIASFIVHRDFSHIFEALTSFYSTTQLPCEVYVTVNTSGNDAEIQQIQQNFPNVHILTNSMPRGFAANHNRVLALAETPYIALLNDDIKLHAGALNRLVSYLDEFPSVAAVGPQLLNADGSYQVSSYSDPSVFRTLYKISGLNRLTHQQSRIRHFLVHRLNIGRVLKVESLTLESATHQVEVLKGVALVIRQSAYKQVGGMDETTMAYGEEIDWCWRFRQANWKLALVTDAHVTHFGSANIGGSLHGDLYIEDLKGILNYYIKHRPRWKSYLIQIGIIIFNLVRGVMWLPFSRVRTDIHFKASRMAWKWKSDSMP